MHLHAVAPSDVGLFRHMVDAYWDELMPTADVLQSTERRDAYFHQTFSWQQVPPQWAVVSDERIGFVHYTLALDQRRATIENFYVLPNQRRRGYGTALVRALYGQFDAAGIELVELHVLRTKPLALAFWEAQGFRIASFRMRQYRDPTTGHAFIGALASDFDPEV